MIHSPKRTLVRFTPWKLVGALCILVPTILCSWMIMQFIPAEHAPRVEDLPNGGRRYVFESLRDAALLPVVFLLIIVFTALTVRFLPYEKPVQRTKPPSLTGALKYLEWFVRGLVMVIVGALCLGLFMLLLMAIVLMPLSTIRVIETDQDTVVFQSLLRTWSLPHTEIGRVDVVHIDVVRKRVPRTNTQFVVRLADGRRFQTAERSYRIGDPQLAPDLEVLQSAKADLLSR